MTSKLQSWSRSERCGKKFARRQTDLVDVLRVTTCKITEGKVLVSTFLDRLHRINRGYLLHRNMRSITDSGSASHAELRGVHWEVDPGSPLTHTPGGSCSFHHVGGSFIVSRCGKREGEWVSDIERERERGKVRFGAWPDWATFYSAFMDCRITYGREMVLISIIALVFVLGEYEHSVSHQAAHPHAHTLHGYTQVRVHITAIHVVCLPPTPPVVEPSCLSPSIL